MSRDPLQLVLLGPPASGKGTQGRRLAETFGLAYLSTGALLREAVASNTPEGGVAKPILDQGGYVSDELMCRLMAPWLEDHRAGWVLDGFPRTLGQDDFLRDWLSGRGESLDAAILLEVPKDELIRRIENRVECPDCRWTGQRSDTRAEGRCPKCGALSRPRADDSLENFLSRYAEFAEHTVPVGDRYRAESMLIACDATAPIDEVARRLLRKIEALPSDGPT